MKKPLKWVAAQLGIEMDSTSEVTGWSIDSRTVRTGDLFFALRGPSHDGHAYIADVFRKGAIAVVADQPVSAEGPVLQVGDSLRALQSLASAARKDWGGEVVGVTGSAGKTTTKDVIAEMLAEGFVTAKTEGNLNNHVGLPLSLLRIGGESKIAVLEMGMNHGGEIRALAEIAGPNVGVVTNVGPAHIENFESLEGVAAAKRELIEALPPDGTAVLNADDERVARFGAAHPGRTVLYGESTQAEVRAERVEYQEEGVKFRVGSVEFESQLTGGHNVSNILAGIAVAGVYGIAPEGLKDSVKSLRPGKMRGERIQHNGISIFDDCYNSNPDAARAMIGVLRAAPARRRIAVLGEMLELGRWAEPLHRNVGTYVAESGIDVLVGLRGAACYMVDAAIRAGLRADAAFFYQDAIAAGDLLYAIAKPGDAILFKGSRGVHVERVLQRFLSLDESGRG